LSIQKLLIISKVFQLLKTEKPTYQPLLFVCQKHIVIMDLLGELQRAEFKEAFDEFDKDGSGSISTKELLHVMRSIGQNPTEDEINELVMESDMNGDGTLQLNEFIEMMKKKSSESDQTEELRMAFHMFDRNKDGYVDAKELKSLLTTMGERLTQEELEEFMRLADMDGDCKLDYEEFAKVMLRR